MSRKFVLLLSWMILFIPCHAYANFLSAATKAMIPCYTEPTTYVATGAGTTYYIDGSILGKSLTYDPVTRTTAAGTYTAWKDFSGLNSTGADNLSAGDLLYVRDGTYRGQAVSDTVSTQCVYNNGTTSNPIVIMAYPGEAVTFTGPLGSEDNAHVFSLNGLFQVLDGISVHGGIAIRTSGCTIQNCEFTGGYWNGTGGSNPAYLKYGNGTYGNFGLQQILANHFKNLDNYGDPSNPLAYVKFINDTTTPMSQECRIDSNFFDTNSGNSTYVAGISFKGMSNHCKIRNNYFNRINTQSSTLITGLGCVNFGSGYYAATGIGPRDDNTDIYNNVFYECTNPIMFDYTCTNSDIYNNTVIGCSRFFTYSNTRNGVTYYMGDPIFGTVYNNYIDVTSELLWWQNNGSDYNGGATCFPTTWDYNIFKLRSMQTGASAYNTTYHPGVNLYTFQGGPMRTATREMMSDSALPASRPEVLLRTR